MHRWFVRCVLWGVIEDPQISCNVSDMENCVLDFFFHSWKEAAKDFFFIPQHELFLWLIRSVRVEPFIYIDRREQI